MVTRAPPSEAAVKQLFDTASLLDVEEVLDLCFAFSKDPVRLTVYLDVLRRKGGMKAQAAACMVCFDLARAGHGHFEREFQALLPVVHEIHSRGDEVLPIIHESDYLEALWADLVRRLGASDPRSEEIDLDIDIDEEEIFEIDLFNDDDIIDIQLDDIVVVAEDLSRLEAGWRNALDRFFVIERALANMHDPNAPLTTGFCADSKADLLRLEGLRDESRSFAQVPHARDMLPVVELFRACHMRARNLFGRENQARAVAVQDGLTAFAELDAPPEDVVAWLTPPTSTRYAWEKTAELLLDYISFLGSLDEQRRTLPHTELTSMYLQAKRPQPPPDRLNSAPGQRRR